MSRGKARNGVEWSPRRLREHLDFEVREWARLLNVNVKTVERWETGAVEPAGLATEVFRGLASALDQGGSPAEIHNRITLGLASFVAASLAPTGAKRS
jgi:DNA-binding XRE family transcriptional regulator